MQQIRVVAAAIKDGFGNILVSRRLDHLHQGGMWEFPGGKIEAGEAIEQALARELQEELGVLPLSCQPLIQISHKYDDRQVELDVYLVDSFQGLVQAMEGQQLRWLPPDEMNPAEFLAADRPVIKALQLPDCYLITGKDPTQQQSFLESLEQALQDGLKVVQLRANELNNNDYHSLSERAVGLCRIYQACLLINRPQRVTDWIGVADGIHLPSKQLMLLGKRPETAGVIGASVHNSTELAQAEELQLDYALLSPVAKTPSHPDSVPLEWHGFRSLVQAANLPVYALGGMRRSHLQQAKNAGGQGIAAISGLWPNRQNHTP